MALIPFENECSPNDGEVLYRRYSVRFQDGALTQARCPSGCVFPAEEPAPGTKESSWPPRMRAVAAMRELLRHGCPVCGPTLPEKIDLILGDIAAELEKLAGIQKALQRLREEAAWAASEAMK